MNMELLVSTMNQTDYSILEKMNIQCDAIIVNQCNKNEFEEFEYKGHKIKFLSFDERGVGLSRNNALMRATADICLIADEDVRYNEGYIESITHSFKENQKADVILFNVPSTNPDRPTFVIPKYRRIRRHNCLRYGAVKIALRTERLKQANVYFSLLFGGGAKYSSGEDSLFLLECIQKGLKVFADPNVIGYVNQENSTWFEGYTDKYYFDKGVWLSNAFPIIKYMLAFYYACRLKGSSDKSVKQMLRLMVSGIRSFKGANNFR